MIVLVESEEALAGFVPDYEMMRRVDGRGLVLTAPSREYDFVSRCFYPKLDVPEDPVTGSAHTYLAPLWAERLGRIWPDGSSSEMRARQVSRRGGDLKVRLAAGRVYITGSACLFMMGDIPFDL